MKIIETDNYGRDYPDERFIVALSLPVNAAEEIATILNDHLSGPFSSRYYRAVKDDYQLQPGFEP